MKLTNINVEKVKKMAETMKNSIVGYAVNGKNKALEKYESSNVDLSFMKKIHFNLHHFTTVSIVAVLAFFVTLYTTGYNTSSVNAAGIETKTVKSYNKEAIDVSYGDSKAIAMKAKDILQGQISTAADLKEISNTGIRASYRLDDYVVTVEMENVTGEQTAKLSIETKDTYRKGSNEKLQFENKNAAEITEGTVYTYNLKLNVIDTEAPRITFTSDDITMDDVDEFSLSDFLSVTDNVDGVISDYSVEGMPGKDGNKFESGKHIITVRAKDSSGNESANSMIVRIYETEETPAYEYGESRNSLSASYGAASYSGAGSVASAALAQLGVGQDCTALVTNSLAAVGIYYHGWPAGYLSLGTVVPASQAQAGDIIYYADGGVGMAHVAVYIGGGQAVHGGYMGTTRIASAYMGSGPVFIRLR